MPSGKVGHHPGWKPLQGSASDHVPGWAPSPCRLPGPVPRYETCLRRVFTAATVSSTPSRAPEKVCGARCAGQFWGSERLGVSPQKSYYERLSSARHVYVYGHACVAEFLGQGRPRLNLGSSYSLGLVLGGVCTGAVVSPPCRQRARSALMCTCGHRLSCAAGASVRASWCLRYLRVLGAGRARAAP